MPIKAAIKTLDEVAETHRALYRQEGEIFVLDTEPALGWGTENIEGLKGTLGKLRKERGDLEAIARNFDGLDATAAREALKKVEEFANIDPKKEADRLAEEKARAKVSQIQSMFDTERAGLVKSRDALKGQLVKLGVDAEIDRALTSLESQGHKIVPSVRGDLRTILRQFVAHEFDDGLGTLKITVHDGAGVPKVKNTAGDLMTIADLVAELPSSRPTFFEAKGVAGGGSQPGGAARSTSNVTNTQRSKMTVQEKSAYISENGLAKYQALPV